MNVGEVFWVEFPPRGGHAQAGRRPAIVAQAASVAGRLPTVLLAHPADNKARSPAVPRHGPCRTRRRHDNGLSRPSVAFVFQLTAIDRRFLSERAGHVSEAVVNSLWSAFDELTVRASS